MYFAPVARYKYTNRILVYAPKGSVHRGAISAWPQTLADFGYTPVIDGFLYTRNDGQYRDNTGFGTDELLQIFIFHKVGNVMAIEKVQAIS